jgi:hypothetical protein
MNNLSLFFLGNNHVLWEREIFFSKNIIAPQSNLSLVPLGTWLFLEEQLKPFFFFKNLLSSISFVNEKISKEKIQTQDLWTIMEILTIALVFFF